MMRDTANYTTAGWRAEDDGCNANNDNNNADIMKMMTKRIRTK